MVTLVIRTEHTVVLILLCDFRSLIYFYLFLPFKNVMYILSDFESIVPNLKLLFR